MKPRKRSIVVLMSLAALALSTSGCNLQEAARDGVTGGVSDALAAIVVTPVSFVLDQIFRAQ